MSILIDRVLRGTFVLGVVGALVFGGHAAFAADRVSSCLCDPEDPDRDLFCEQCCPGTGSMCPVGGGTEPRECICT